MCPPSFLVSWSTTYGVKPLILFSELFKACNCNALRSIQFSWLPVNEMIHYILVRIIISHHEFVTKTCGAHLIKEAVVSAAMYCVRQFYVFVRCSILRADFAA